MRFPCVTLLASTLLAVSVKARFAIHADEWHPTRPTNPQDRAGIDHVVIAFAKSNATATFQPKVPINTIRTEYPNSKVMIAVGGWADDIGFYQATKSDASMQLFAANVATMLTNTGADGVDIDWEYPGGNGADYKEVRNSDKSYQIAAFPNPLAAIRVAIGGKLLSIAVPGKQGDMLGYTRKSGPQIWPSVDFINVMSYDLMNRRDKVTKHHSSVVDSEEIIKGYLAIGAPPEKLNLGFAYYAKYFTTQGDCSSSPLNCPIVAAEDAWGHDTFTSGAWTFEKFHMHPVDTSALSVSWDGTCGPEKGTKCGAGCCSQHSHCGTSLEHCHGACQHAFGTGCTDVDVAGSWQLAAKHGVTDEAAGGQYYFDAQNRLFWTWDTPELITRKFEEIVRKYKLGGVMAWSLGEDSADWSHVRQMAREVAKGGHQLATADDSIIPPVLPVGGLVEAAPPAPEKTHWPPHWRTHLGPKPTQRQSAAAEASTAPDDFVDYATELDLTPDYAVSYDGNGSVQYASNEEVNPELGTAPQDPSAAVPAAEVESSTAIHFEPVATIEPGIVTHIGISHAQENEFSGGSYRVRRRERAHKA